LAAPAQAAPRFKVLIFAPPTKDLGHASYPRVPALGWRTQRLWTSSTLMPPAESVSM
jgi:hypothetical protein